MTEGMYGQTAMQVLEIQRFFSAGENQWIVSRLDIINFK